MFPEAVSTNTVWESWVTPKDHLGSSYFFPDFLSSPYSWHRELELAGVGERGEIRKKKKKIIKSRLDSLKHENNKIYCGSSYRNLASLGERLKATCDVQITGQATFRSPVLPIFLAARPFGNLPRALCHVLPFLGDYRMKRGPEQRLPVDQQGRSLLRPLNPPLKL